MVPGMFVANAVKTFAAGRPDAPEIVIVSLPGHVTDTQRAWFVSRGIAVAEDFDLAPLRGIEMLDPRLTPATLLKLLLPIHLAGRYDKILYLDADLGIEHDLTPLLALDTGEFALAACPAGRVWAGWVLADRQRSESQFRALGMTEPYRYINTGVLLIDVAKWNRSELTPRVLAFIRANPALCRLPDEDALNAVLDGRQAELSAVWNLGAEAWSHPEIRAVTTPGIVHYLGPAKPWKRFGDGRRLFEFESAYRAYQRFLAGTPWQGWLRAQWSGRDIRQNIRHDLRHLVRRVRGRPTPTSPRQRRLYTEAMLSHRREARFADVDQGIVIRNGAELRIAEGSASR